MRRIIKQRVEHSYKVSDNSFVCPNGTNLCLIGLRVAQVRALFTLPVHLQEPLLPTRLAYVEWFNPLRPPDTDSRLHLVSRSIRHHAPVAAVIPVEDIVCTCHLIPKYGTRHRPGAWASEDALEICKTFYLNKYIRPSTFIDYDPPVSR